MDITVRRAHVADIDEITRIETESFSVPWSKQLLREEITFPLSLSLVVCVDGTVKGYLFAWLIPPEVHILNLAVDPSLRKKGLGERLMEALFEEGKKNGGTRVTLEVRSRNLKTVEFYQKFKFVVKGVRKGYYQDTGDDALIMWREGGD